MNPTGGHTRKGKLQMYIDGKSALGGVPLAAIRSPRVGLMRRVDLSAADFA